jgi:hypothetical protein
MFFSIFIYIYFYMFFYMFLYVLGIRRPIRMGLHEQTNKEVKLCKKNSRMVQRDRDDLVISRMNAAQAALGIGNRSGVGQRRPCSWLWPP